MAPRVDIIDVNAMFSFSFSKNTKAPVILSTEKNLLNNRRNNRQTPDKMSTSRFPVVSNEQREQIITDKDAKNTKKATKVAWNALTSWLTARKKAMDPSVISKQELDELLAQFFLEARQQNGTFYKTSAFRGLRNGIARKFKQLRQFDILNDPMFINSKTSFLAQNVEMKKQGMGKIKHKEAITERDLALLQSSGVMYVPQFTDIIGQESFLRSSLLLLPSRDGESPTPHEDNVCGES